MRTGTPLPESSRQQDMATGERRPEGRGLAVAYLIFGIVQLAFGAWFACNGILRGRHLLTVGGLLMLAHGILSVTRHRTRRNVD
jgi:hypothetical protein